MKVKKSKILLLKTEIYWFINRSSISISIRGCETILSIISIYQIPCALLCSVMRQNHRHFETSFTMKYRGMAIQFQIPNCNHSSVILKTTVNDFENSMSNLQFVRKRNQYKNSFPLHSLSKRVLRSTSGT